MGLWRFLSLSLLLRTYEIFRKKMLLVLNLETGSEVLIAEEILLFSLLGLSWMEQNSFLLIHLLVMVLLLSTA